MKIGKTDIIVDISSVGMCRWDCFESVLYDLKTGNGQNLLDWFNKHFNVIKFTPTKSSMEKKMKEILSTDCSCPHCGGELKQLKGKYKIAVQI